ncbi:MAG: glycosyltransferase family 2 protein [Flavobacteriales bacterium]|nr:glycosyltransferase family 2 protein [Flavobacteriales bacterium]
MINHTFIVLAYKDSPYLPECLESLVNQTSKSELLICTSTPSKYISDLAERYDIEVLVAPSGLGSLHDNNFAFRQARTKYVTIAHQDDVYMPKYAEACVTAAEMYPDTLIAFTNGIEVVRGELRYHSNLMRVKRMMLFAFMPFQKTLKSKFLKRGLLSLGNPISAPTVMYNMDNLPNFQFISEFSDNLDWDNWLRIANMSGRFVYLPEVLIQRRLHEHSQTSAGIKTSRGEAEDMSMFMQFWPKPIAKILTRLYSVRTKSNDVT